MILPVLSNEKMMQDKRIDRGLYCATFFPILPKNKEENGIKIFNIDFIKHKHEIIPILIVKMHFKCKL